MQPKRKTTEHIKVVILCGGRGTRMGEGGDNRPKGLMVVGGRPILWHLLKLFSHHGFNEFVFCLGYGSEMIKEYFYSYFWKQNNFRLDVNSGEVTLVGSSERDRWKIDFIETGSDAGTAERIIAVQPFVDTDPFFVSYGDDIADVSFPDLLTFHRNEGRMATLTGVAPYSPFGVLRIDGARVKEFVEKPRLEQRINGGFYVFNKSALGYLDEGSNLEAEPLTRLAAKGQLSIYPHDGFWNPVNTRKDLYSLNKLWYSRTAPAPWKIW